MHQPKPASGQVPQIVISHMADNSKIYVASLDDQKVIAVNHYKHGNCNFIMGKIWEHVSVYKPAPPRQSQEFLVDIVHQCRGMILIHGYP
jgi:hypothetical protein